MTEVTDILGNAVQVGDNVAGAFRVGNVAQLRIGKVVGFGERGNNVTVQIHWTKSSGAGFAEEVNIHGGIEADLHRFVRIG